MNRPSVLILGTRGIPASHGGFETFAERLALYLVERGWDVGVYCQKEVNAVRQRFSHETWNGVELIHVEVARHGPAATLEFDWHCTRDAARRDSVCLVLGYNSAVFLPYLRLAGRKVITNMDGFEWRRSKWSRPVRAWFYANEWIAARVSHRLVADHPAIADHLATRRSRKATTVIPYGGIEVTQAPTGPLEALELEPDGYLISVARIEPENSILPIVQAFSRRRRGYKLVVLGSFQQATAFQQAVRAAASDEVVFPGAVYESERVQALRFHARAYVHGHTVGGTNPSLVEALWAGNAVIAHDNVFNRWTAGEAQFFFKNADELDQRIGHVFSDAGSVAQARLEARSRAKAQFDWSDVLSAYETELLALGGHAVTQPRPLPAWGRASRAA
jgi:glycosyltransferase involved in cell wall biosynthesis